MRRSRLPGMLALVSPARSTHGESLDASAGPRCGFTLTAIEVEALASIMEALMRGGDARVLARSEGAKTFTGKILRGRQRVRAARGA